VRLAGSLAGVDLPDAVSNATYDASNQLTKWGASVLAYDANGNLTKEGARSYTWSERNQLAAIIGTTTATFQYDPFGRRSQTTIGTSTRSYLYDLDNPVQELSGTAPLATMLTGLGLDEHYGRTEGTNTSYYLTDALGSTVALTNATGIVTRYAHQPYGATTATGPTSTNPYQFIGRENDGTGLYHYRARYYSPGLHRFISEDPVEGRPGRAATYSYADGDPLNKTDPSGQFAILLIPVYEIALAGVGLMFALMAAQYALQSGGAACLSPSLDDWVSPTTHTMAGPKHPASELPTGGSRPYRPPKQRGNPEVVKNPGGKGWVDEYDNVWEWAHDQHGGPHWDVQHDDGSHTNVTPEGEVIGEDNFPNKS
jgi:RHS repeat-associated protein